MTSYAIGLDVGGAKVAGGVVDCATGEVILRQIIPTQAARGGEAVLADCVTLAERCNILDPAAVIVGGGLGLAGGLYWEAFVNATRAHIYAEDTRALPILPAVLGVDAGGSGAAVRS